MPGFAVLRTRASPVLHRPVAPEGGRPRPVRRSGVLRPPDLRRSQRQTFWSDCDFVALTLRRRRPGDIRPVLAEVLGPVERSVGAFEERGCGVAVLELADAGGEVQPP